MNTSSPAVLSWLLTYALHSTVLLVLARVITSRKISATSRDVIWKSALVGGIVTASVQQAFDVRPSGSMRLPAAAATSAAQARPATDHSTELKSKKNEPRSTDAEVSLSFSGDEQSSAPAASTRLSLSDGLVLGWIIVAL